MYELGKREDCFGMTLLAPLQLIGMDRNIKSLYDMPTVPTGHSVICGYDQGLGERMIVCETLEDMKTLYEKFAQGYAIKINWYSGPDSGFISVVKL